MKIIIGTRGSELALSQTKEIVDRLKSVHPYLELFIKIIKTEGDKLKNEPLTRIGGKGIFTKEIEKALLKKEIDIAVHSAKDLPTDLPKELVIAAVIKRHDPHDCLITKDKEKLENLKKGARIGTGSLRRKTQLLNYRKDFNIVDIRGNITTRMKKLKDLDGIILSVCGLNRLYGEKVPGTYFMDIIPYSIMLPAAGQGALGVETRKNDKNILNLLKPLNDLDSQLAVQAERSFLSKLGGGCQVPMGCLAAVNKNKIKLRVRIGATEYELTGEKGESLSNWCRPR